MCWQVSSPLQWDLHDTNMIACFTVCHPSLRGSTADIRKLALALMVECLTEPKCMSSRAPLLATMLASVLAQKKHLAWQTAASALNPAWDCPSSFICAAQHQPSPPSNPEIVSPPPPPPWLQVRYGTLCCWM